MSEWEGLDQQTLFDNPGLLENPVAGEQAKEEGQSNALKAMRVELWKELANDWFAARYKGTEFTMDDVVRNAGLPDQGANRNNVLGAWMAAKAKRGEIEWTGEMVRSRRVTRHVGLQRVWRKL